MKSIGNKKKGNKMRNLLAKAVAWAMHRKDIKGVAVFLNKNAGANICVNMSTKEEMTKIVAAIMSTIHTENRVTYNSFLQCVFEVANIIHEEEEGQDEAIAQVASLINGKDGHDDDKE